MIMIRPVDALTPKVLFRGQTINHGSLKTSAKKRIALINAAGISTVTGGLITVVSRSYTSNWKNAGFIGLASAAVSMMFLGPQFLYKSGINTYVKHDEAKKKLLTDVIDNQKGTIETIVKKAV